MQGNTLPVLLGLAGGLVGKGDRTKGSPGIWEKIGAPGGGGGQSLLDRVQISIQETERQRLCRSCGGSLKVSERSTLTEPGGQRKLRGACPSSVLTLVAYTGNSQNSGVFRGNSIWVLSRLGVKEPLDPEHHPATLLDLLWLALPSPG